MKLATLKSDSRDGALVVVNRQGTHFLEASHIAPTLQSALETWDKSEAPLKKLFEKVEKEGGHPLSITDLHSPLPRAFRTKRT